jgi:hypothetical protein
VPDWLQATEVQAIAPTLRMNDEISRFIANISVSR